MGYAAGNRQEVGEKWDTRRVTGKRLERNGIRGG